MQYYVRRNDKVVGPVSPQQLAEGIKAKKFLGTDEISISNTDGFTALKDVYKLAINGEWAGSIGTFAQSIVPIDDDFWGNIPVAAAVPVSQYSPNPPKVNSYLQKAHEEAAAAENQKSEGRDENTRNYYFQMIIGSIIIVLGIAGFLVAVKISEPMKLRWAADDALSRMVSAAAMAEELMGATSPRAQRLQDNAIANMEQAAVELQSILDQMTPEDRENWETYHIEELAKSQMRRR